jgi:uncharacterized Zn finger protein
MSVPGCSMVVMAIATAFTEADLKGAADARSFDRGLGYVDEVEDLEVSDTEITASVYGTSRYRVSLIFGDEGLNGDCTCPYGREGFFCKHCVAVGLCVLKLGDDLPRRIEAARTERRALGSWLESLSKEELLAELSGLLDQEPDLRRRFELRAASVNLDAAAVRRAVRELIMLPRRGFVEYSEAYDYANDVSKAAAAIDDLTDAGGAADAIGIAREAIDLLCDAFESVDDSSGAIGDAGYALLEAHLTACEAAPPDPVSLGDYLADQLLLHSDYGLELNLADYAELLGDEGLATVHDRVATAYAENPENWRAKSLMEAITKAEGDVDALIAVLAAQLDDRGWTHLRIASELDEAGRTGEALDWAERGLREATHPDERLVDYLAGRYAAEGRDELVLSLRRDRFQAERTLAHYQSLRSAATDSGVWPAERGPALALLREDAGHLRIRVPWAWGGPVLVDALLDDGDLDAALTAARAAASTTEAQWLRLADALASTRPADALPAYLRTVESLKQLTGNEIYQRIATVLLAARACHQALGTTAEFRRYVALLRMEQKRKRNLMKILDQNGL